MPPNELPHCGEIVAQHLGLALPTEAYRRTVAKVIGRTGDLTRPPAERPFAAARLVNTGGVNSTRLVASHLNYRTGKPWRSQPRLRPDDTEALERDGHTVFLGDLRLKQDFQSKLCAPQLFGVAPSERVLDLFEKSLRIVVRLKFKKFGRGDIE
jgi:hypothetical protein